MFKFLLAGAASVGKSKLVGKFIENEAWNDSYKPTNGVDFKMTTMYFEDSEI